MSFLPKLSKRPTFSSLTCSIWNISFCFSPWRVVSYFACVSLRFVPYFFYSVGSTSVSIFVWFLALFLVFISSWNFWCICFICLILAYPSSIWGQCAIVPVMSFDLDPAVHISLSLFIFAFKIVLCVTFWLSSVCCRHTAWTALPLSSPTALFCKKWMSFAVHEKLVLWNSSEFIPSEVYIVDVHSWGCLCSSQKDVYILYIYKIDSLRCE